MSYPYIGFAGAPDLFADDGLHGDGRFFLGCVSYAGCLSKMQGIILKFRQFSLQMHSLTIDKELIVPEDVRFAKVPLAYTCNISRKREVRRLNSRDLVWALLETLHLSATGRKAHGSHTTSSHICKMAHITCTASYALFTAMPYLRQNTNSSVPRLAVTAEPWEAWTQVDRNALAV